MAFSFGAKVPDSRKPEEIIISLRKNMFSLIDTYEYYRGCFNESDLNPRESCENSQLELAEKSLPIYLERVKKDMDSLVEVDGIRPPQGMGFINQELSGFAGQIKELHDSMVGFRITKINSLNADDLKTLVQGFWARLTELNIKKVNNYYISMQQAYQNWQKANNVY